MKTDNEKAGEVLHELLENVSSQHEAISIAHRQSLENDENITSPWKLRHLTLDALSHTSSTIYSRIITSRDLKARARNSTIIAQLSDAYLQIGSHYHATGITDAKRQEKWLPAIQGVRHSIIFTPDQAMATHGQRVHSSSRIPSPRFFSICTMSYPLTRPFPMTPPWRKRWLHPQAPPPSPSSRDVVGCSGSAPPLTFAVSSQASWTNGTKRTTSTSQQQKTRQGVIQRARSG